MVSEFFLNATVGLVDVYGMSAEQLLTIFTVFFAVGFAVLFSIRLQNRDIGVAVFFMSLVTAFFLQLISILVIAIPLILAALFYFYKGADE